MIKIPFWNFTLINRNYNVKTASKETGLLLPKEKTHRYISEREETEKRKKKAKQSAHLD